LIRYTLVEKPLAAIVDGAEPITETTTASSNFGAREDYTYLSMSSGELTGDRTFDVEGHTRALICTANGTAIHLNVAWASNRKYIQHIQIHGVEAGATIAPGDESFVIHGTKARTLSTNTRTPKPTDVYDAEWSYFFGIL
jgi:predicted dehydrogenase